MKTCYVIGDDYLTSLCIENLIKNSTWRVLGLVTTSARLKERWIHELPLYDSLANFSNVIPQGSFDYLFSIVNSHIIPTEILCLPRYLAINYHGSPLPKYAGWEPISWAILNEEKTYGITWHVMREQVDRGEIVLQIPLAIEPNETAFTLRAKCFDAGLASFSKLIERLNEKDIPQLETQDFEMRSYYGRNQKPKHMGFIHWQSSAEAIERFCRAFYFGEGINWVISPKIRLDSNVFIVEKADILFMRSITAPGTLMRVESDGLIVSTATYDIKLSGLKNLMGDHVALMNQGWREGDNLQINPNSLDELDKLIDKGTYLDEFFLLRALDNYEPLEVAGIPNPEKIFYPYQAKISLTHEKKEDYAEFLSVLGLYFSRFTQQEALSLKIQLTPAYTVPQELAPCFLHDVPFNLTLDFHASYAELKEKVTQQLKNKAYQKMYAKEVAYRYKSKLEGKYRLFLDTKITVVLCKAVDSYAIPPSGFYVLLAPQQGVMKVCVNSDCQDLIFLSRNLQAHLPHLYASVSANDSLILSQIPLMPVEEQQQITQAGNDNRFDYAFCSLYDIVSAQAKNKPEQNALIVDSHSFTYQALLETSERIARALFYHYAIKSQDCIGVAMARSNSMIEMVLALLQLNCQIVPITSTKWVNTISESILAGNLKAIVADEAFISDVPELSPECLLIPFAHLKEKLTDPFMPIPERVSHPDDIALITFTSGTTGLPKAIPTTQDGWINWIHFMKNKGYVTEKEVIFAACSFGFDAFFWELMVLGLGQGACLVLSRESERLDTNYWKRLFQMRSIGVTQVTITPPMLSLFTPDDFPSVKRIYCIGEKLSMNLIQPFLLRGIEIINGYGPSEVTAGATLYPCQFNQVPYIGVPIQNTQIYILDPFKQPVPVGAYGEMYIAGKGLSPGYLQLPEKNATCFIPNPFLPPQKMYKTGDKARYVSVSGLIEFIGRIEENQQVKLHGIRIELGEIEFLLSCQSGIKAAHAHVIKNQSHTHLVAYVVTDRSDLCEKSIRQALSEKMDFFKLPERIIVVDQFPLNHRGKIDVSRLPNPYTDYVPVYQTESLSISERVLSIFRYYLGLPALQLDDRWDECGGNSFAVMTIWNTINQALLKPTAHYISFADFIAACQSPREIALWIETHLSDSLDSQVPQVEDSNETTSALLLSFGIFDAGPAEVHISHDNAVDPTVIGLN